MAKSSVLFIIKGLHESVFKGVYKGKEMAVEKQNSCLRLLLVEDREEILLN